MPIDDHQIRKFLLGRVSENEDEEIGVRLISDDAFGERFDQAESELVEDFLDGLLPEDDERSFRQHFLVTSERLRLLNEVALFRAATLRHSTCGPDPSKPASHNGSASVKRGSHETRR